MTQFSEMFESEGKKVEKANKFVDQAAQDCMSKARICFALKQFADYKKQYQQVEDKMLVAMAALTESYLAGKFDLITYGARMLVYMTRLKDLKLLLSVVESDIRKGEKNG